MKFEDILYALIVVVVLSGNHVISKIALSHFPPIYLTALRMSLVAFVLLPLLRMPPISLGHLYLISFNQNICHHVLFAAALSLGLPAATSAITTQLHVPFTSLLAIFLLKDKPSLKQVTGMLISFLGIGVVMGEPSLSGQTLPFVLSVIGAVFFAIFSIQVKQIKNLKILPFIAWSSLLAAPQLFIISWWFEPRSSWSLLVNADSAVWLAVFYMVTTTIVGIGLWFYLLQNYSVNLVAPFSLLVPVLGVLFANVYLNEPVTWHIIIGGVITVAGLAAIIIRKSPLGAAKTYANYKDAIIKS